MRALWSVWESIWDRLSLRRRCAWNAMGPRRGAAGSGARAAGIGAAGGGYGSVAYGLPRPASARSGFRVIGASVRADAGSGWKATGAEPHIRLKEAPRPVRDGAFSVFRSAMARPQSVSWAP